MDEQTLEIARECERESDSIAVDLFIDRLPCRYKDNCFRSIATRRLKNAVNILTRMLVACIMVGIVLSSNFNADLFEENFDSIIDPIETSGQSRSFLLS